MAVADDRDERLPIAENQRVVGHHWRPCRHVHLELYRRVHPRIERLVVIWQINLDQHRASFAGQRIGMTRNCAREDSLRIFGHGYSRWVTVTDKWRGALRHI